MFVTELFAVPVEGVIENARIETAYSTQEVNNFQADLAIDGSNDTCFKTNTGLETSLLLTLDGRRTVVGVSMTVKGRMSRTYHQWGLLVVHYMQMYMSHIIRVFSYRHTHTPSA